MTRLLEHFAARIAVIASVLAVLAFVLLRHFSSDTKWNVVLVMLPEPCKNQQTL